MTTRNHRLARSLVAGTGLAAGALAGPALAQTTAAYEALTNTYRSVTNFNVETVRGLDVDSAGVLAINTHGSTLVRYTGGAATGTPPVFPTESWPTLNNPIAFEVWTETYDGGSTDYAVVVGGGTHAVCLHDLSTPGGVGRIVRTTNLAAEPGDIVIDHAAGRAFVSVPGNNTVVQLGLPLLELQATYSVASERPKHLYLDTLGETTTVLVAPELSGNNTVDDNAVVDANQVPILLNSSSVAVDLKPFLPAGLPDEDLFRITPLTPGTGPVLGVAQPQLRNAATILQAHGRNPVTDDYWMLGIESLNTQALTEPDQNGVFARNVLVVAGAMGGSPLPFTHTVVDLDGAQPYDANLAISFPWALEFHPTGWAAVAGSASDQVRILDSTAARFGDLELPPGSIPRDLEVDVTGNGLFVYCWGTNEVRFYDLNLVLAAIAGAGNGVVGPGTGLVGVLELGADPNPARVKHGREIFYDADNSAAGRLTCAHCHPGGGMDLLGWNIQDFPHDHKELMVTQSLKSIEDTFPYHWRGERDLEAFNGAFKGLLGGALLGDGPGGDLEDFKMFVFSLQAHANPLQDPRRLVNAELPFDEESHVPFIDSLPDAVRGQTLMHKPDVLFDRFTCAECHGLETGSVGDPQIDDVSAIPTGITLDVAHFRQLFHKTQDIVEISPGLFAPRGGFGISQDGDHPSTLDFLARNPFDIDQQEQLDLAAFVAQADQGIAPSAHLAYTVDAGTGTSTIRDITNLLLGQSGATFTDQHWVSIAVIGSHQDQGGTTHDLTWFWNTAASAFVASDPAVTFPNGSTGSQTWAALQAEAAAGRAVFTVIGLPPGNSLRFAVDVDDDGLVDRLEPGAGTDPFDPDFDDDGFPDGYEVTHSMNPLVFDSSSPETVKPWMSYARIEHMGASYGKLVLGFSEPVTLEITATNATTGHVAVEKRFVPRAFDTVTVQRLVPSMPALVFTPTYPIPSIAAIPAVYQLDIKMTDLAGNFDTVSTGPVATTRDLLAQLPFPRTQQGNVANMPPISLQRVLENPQWVGSTTGTTLQATVDTRILFDVPELANAYLNPPNTPNGSSDPNEKQVVVAQVIRQSGPNGPWEVLPMSGTGLSVTAPTGRIFTQVDLRGDPTPLVPNPPTIALDFDPATNPHFLLSTESGASGQVTFDFTLSGPIPAGDTVRLNFIGILERDYRDGAPLNEFWLGSIGNWNMPKTAEGERYLELP